MLNNNEIEIEFLGKKVEKPLIHNTSSKIWMKGANASLHLNFHFATVFVRPTEKYYLVNGWACNEATHIRGWNFDNVFMDREPESMAYKHLMDDPRSEEKGITYFFKIDIIKSGEVSMMDIATKLRDFIETL